MNLYLEPILEGAALIIIIVVILWIALRKFRNERKVNMRDALLSAEELEGHAKTTAIEHTVSKSQILLNWPIPRMNENYDYILSVYKKLNEDIKIKYTVPPAAEWLLDNFYIIEEQVKGLRRDLIKKNYLKLPVLKSGLLRGYARIFAVAVELVAHTDGQIDERTLSDYLQAYQSHSVLFDREIWSLPLVLRLALLENIRHLCEMIQNTQQEWHKADDFFDEWILREGLNTNKLIKLFKESFKTMDEANLSFIEHLFYRLRRSGFSYAEVLRIVDENLSQLGTNTEQVTQKEHNARSVNTVSMGNCITSLRFLSTMDWTELFENSSFVEQLLKQDPDGTYPQMDLPTRNYYRSRVEALALTYGVSELYIANEVLALARQSYSDWDAQSQVDAQTRRTWHVGFYLIGKGLKRLDNRQKKKNRFLPRSARPDNKSTVILYIGTIGLITLLLVYIAAEYILLSPTDNRLLFSLLAAFAVLIPASEIAINAVNWVVCTAIKPAFFPRLELKDGIPVNLSTIIAVPTLLPDENRVKELLGNLESHYLSNREDNLYFVLLGAFKDADSAVLEGDEKIVETGMQITKELNLKYATGGKDKFYFFHRERQFNEKNNKWIGWERKRGALIEFNELVMGSLETSFIFKSNEKLPFSNVKYIITLDSDTILPMGMASKMIGAMAHPLNAPVVDEKKGIVTEGYGLMQPRGDFDSESSNKSLFSRIFTGQEGIDPYSNLISDVYQDLFDEGIFTGKGIYDLNVFQKTLKDAIPENTVLSHDLLEGSFVRTGFLTDLRLVDAYPTKYNSFIARQHRWVRGDWQLLPMLFGKKINNGNTKIENPLSLLSKWKMFDNLRRSLVAPSLILLVALSFSILPGSIYFWLGFFIFAQASPLVISILSVLISKRFGNRRIKRYIPVILGIKATFLQGLLSLVFLPHKAWTMANAICVTLFRVLITKKNLLEWVTAADVEKTQKNSLKSYLIKMKSSVFESVVILIFAFIFKPDTIIVGSLFLIIWGSSPFIAFWVSKDEKEKGLKVSEEDLLELGRIARKTWRYFEELSNQKSHFLAPDNYQVDPPRGVAPRTSPTNIGFGLLSTLSAGDLGYIGTSEMIDLIDKTFTTIESLEKWNGHLYNWYDTRTLKTLRPCYISTVDSGNLASYLITLVQGLKEYIDKPLVDKRFLYGLRDTVYCDGIDGVADFKTKNQVKTLLENDDFDLTIWNRILDDFIKDNGFINIKDVIWRTKLERMVRVFKIELSKSMPGIDLMERLPKCLINSEYNVEIAASVSELLIALRQNIALHDISAVYREKTKLIDKIIDVLQKAGINNCADGYAWMYELENALSKAVEYNEVLLYKINNLINRINTVLHEMKFAPLYDKKKHLFSIGYNLDENKLTNSYYDLLASEARQTSYLCIARGEVPPSHWFLMGRILTVVDYYKGLISWTGTMFEYLMPLLVMNTYKNTLLDETYSFVIKSQKKYGKQRNMPWGTSESGFNSLDINLDYQYKAIGVPWLGLKRGLIEDAVAAPYATFLALHVDPEGAIQNIKYLKSEGLDGPYGFYEAADYTRRRLPFETKRAIVKSFMAHHQGMSLVSLNNYLNKNIMQKRFNSDPEMHAARLLLQERIPTNLIFTKETKEKVVPFKENISREKNPIRRFEVPDSILPNAHILSNGNYSIMITDKGTGYSKNQMLAVTRWREDISLDTYGMFFFIRNLDTNTTWSSTYAPINILPEDYEVVFTADKATFKRRDEHIRTETEVIVASGDNAEIRRISLKNFGDKPCTIEITSYFEAVLTTQAADVAHPVFSNLFVETEAQPDKKCIIATRRSRIENDKNIWCANNAVIEGEMIGDIQYETDRMRFIGRGHTVKTSVAVEKGKQLSETVGPVLDPVMSMRIKVIIEPGRTARISFVTSISESNELMLSLIEKYSTPEAVDGAFRLSFAKSQVETKFLNLSVPEIELYQSTISHILFLSPLRRTNKDLILPNNKGQSSLWRYGISGDLPIVLVVLKKIDQVEILNEILKAHEYWLLMDLKVDLVVLSDEEYNYTQPLYRLISDIVASSQMHDIANKPGDIYILERNKMPVEEVFLLFAVARVALFGDGRTMTEQINVKSEQLLPKKIEFLQTPREYEQPQNREPDLVFNNGIGGFSQDGNEYVIHLDKNVTTPAPWVNVIANPKFGFIVSESGSGYTWFGNSRENKLTPWSNDIVSDTPGEILYLVDGETGQQWSLTCLPVREEESYTITHGFGYSVFGHVSHGIKQRLTHFVPLNESVKVSLLDLKNISDQRRYLTLTYYIRPILGVSDQVTAMHIRTKLDKTGTLLIENPYNEEFIGRICYLDSSIQERSVTGDRKEFFGSGDIASPESLLRESLSGTVGIGLDPCAAIQVKVMLEPNENREIVFLLGMAAKLQEVNDLTRKYKNSKAANDALAEVIEFWKNKMNVVQVSSPTTPMNLMLNGWLPYQVISCRLWARSGFYQSGGAFGFRDQLQDALSIAHIWPEIAHAQILLHARHQFTQGDVQHWWHDPNRKGTRTRISDDLLWLPYVTAEYIRITGDKKILDEELSFLDEPILAENEDERYGSPDISNIKSSLYDHCVRAVNKTLKFGVHGLPLMGTGDWNDGMNTVGNKGFGESVWLGWFLVTVLEMMSQICSEMDDDKKAYEYSEIRVNVLNALEKFAWDGNWYRRAYFDNGTLLGSTQNIECKIDSIAQSWSVISGAGNPLRAELAMNSLDDFLVCREDGLIKLLTPPFDEGEIEPGYIKAYIPGVRENGGQYTHAAVWAIIAFAKLGDGDKAWELFELINPINLTNNFREYSKYKVEPYVMAADVYSEYPHTGRGGWSWYTGAAGWMYRTGLEFILGFQKNGETLIMDPCIPKKWKQYSIKYRYIDTNYVINVKNPQSINKGVKRISVDSTVSSGNCINLVNDKATHEVEVIMG